MHEENGFTEISKNLAYRYRSENNFVFESSK